jgi:hypothetical protein
MAIVHANGEMAQQIWAENVIMINTDKPLPDVSGKTRAGKPSVALKLVERGEVPAEEPLMRFLSEKI